MCSVTKIFVITVTSCVRDQDATTAPPRHVGHRILKLTPIHALSHLSDSLNLLNSLNSINFLFHLGKIPFF